MKRIIIPGPPGTGKTYHLTNHYLRKELEEYKTNPIRIAYITFSNAAADEAKKRIFNLFPNYDMKKHFPYVSTMHSMGTRQLNIDTNTKLLNGKNKWQAFKNFSQICKDLNFDSQINELGHMVHKNRHMQVIEYARNKKINLIDASRDLGLHHSLNLYKTEQIYKDLISYKKHTGMVEFSDMINEFVKKDKCPPLDVVFLDEAQDLNPLQWDMFFYIESKCKRSYIAGDDDQTIYTFQGASEDIFINLKGEKDPRIESRRVPKAVHKVALSILDNIENRMDKNWLPRDAEGSVSWDQRIEDIDFSKGDWMIIARTNTMLNSIKEHLVSLNLRFTSKENDFLPNPILKAYRIWVRLNNGATVSGEEAKLLYDKCLNYNLKHTKRNYAQGQSLKDIDSVDLDDLMMDHGLLIHGDWKQLDIAPFIKTYMKELIANGDDLLSEPRIKVSTIHGVKGEECTNVVLFTDLEKIIYESAQRNPDPEHRLFFVGVTRTKENLYIMRQMEDKDYSYSIGDQII
jgi:superfamily I DNA/RNA helicase